MFDKLVESSSAEAEFKSRRKFFLVSSVIVGILFITAVVASIYAADYGIGTGNIELAELLVPVTQTSPIQEVEPTARRPQTATETALQTTRKIPMASTSDPTRAPNETSTAINTSLSIPDSGRFVLGPTDQNGPPPVSFGAGDLGSFSGPANSSRAENDLTPEKQPPPPVKKIAKPVVQTKGVINGEARSLPKPIYPPAALALRISGAVNVQVTIDESGKVISAKAASGHLLLRKAAEEAAWKARFSPTYLSDVPVKVTGVIVYNFSH